MFMRREAHAGEPGAWPGATLAVAVAVGLTLSGCLVNENTNSELDTNAHTQSQMRTTDTQRTQTLSTDRWNMYDCRVLHSCSL